MTARGAYRAARAGVRSIPMADLLKPVAAIVGLAAGLVGAWIGINARISERPDRAEVAAMIDRNGQFIRESMHQIDSRLARIEDRIAFIRPAPEPARAAPP